MRSPLGLGRGQTPPSTACDCSTRPRLPTSSVVLAEGMMRSHVEPTHRFHARLGPPLQGAPWAYGVLSAPGVRLSVSGRTRLCNAWIGSPGPLGYAAWTFPVSYTHLRAHET